MAIVEVICLQNPVAGDERYSFTVPGVAGTDVAIAAPGTPPFLRNALGNSRFQARDNFTVLSAGVWHPYGFGSSTVLPAVTFRYRVGVAESPIIPIGSGSGQIIIPHENYEMVLDTFVPWPNFPAGASTVPLATVAYLDAGYRVSVLNCPALLFGATLPLVIWAKIYHNLPMIA